MVVNIAAISIAKMVWALIGMEECKRRELIAGADGFSAGGEGTGLAVGDVQGAGKKLAQVIKSSSSKSNSAYKYRKNICVRMLVIMEHFCLKKHIPFRSWIEEYEFVPRCVPRAR